MPLISRRTFPPGGFQFFQPQTGWSAPGGLTFDQVVDALVAHRRANPRFNLSTDWETVANELDNFTCVRLGQNPHYCHGNSPPSFRGGPPRAPRPAQASRPGARAAAVGVTEHFRRSLQGAKLLKEWLGSNPIPVANPVAEARAKVCVECPHNDQGDFWQRLDAAAARALKATLQLRTQLDLKTPYDERLKSCTLCDCWLPLKVHVPLDLILKETSAAMLESFRGVRTRTGAACWIIEKPALTGPVPVS